MRIRKRKKRRRNKKCGASGKIKYRTALDAKIALANTQKARSPKREEVRFYRCPNCGCFHLTKKRYWRNSTPRKTGPRKTK